MRLPGRGAIGSRAEDGPHEEVMDEVAVLLAKGASVGGPLQGEVRSHGWCDQMGTPKIFACGAVNVSSKSCNG